MQTAYAADLLESDYVFEDCGFLACVRRVQVVREALSDKPFGIWYSLCGVRDGELVFVGDSDYGKPTMSRVNSPADGWVTFEQSVEYPMCLHLVFQRYSPRTELVRLTEQDARTLLLHPYHKDRTFGAASAM